MADVEQARAETREMLRDAGVTGELDLSYIDDDVLREIENAADVDESTLAEFGSTDPEADVREHGAELPPAPQPNLRFELIYGHHLVVIGAVHYFKLVRSGTSECLETEYRRWPRVDLRRWVGTCPHRCGKYQLGRWI